jgi:hypothetical protein
MAFKKGRNININDTAVLLGPIALNNSTSVKLIDANANRMFFSISVDGTAWLKFQPAADDDLNRGILVATNSTFTMPVDNMYTGEISAISFSGTPNAYVTEY